MTSIWNTENAAAYSFQKTDGVFRNYFGREYESHEAAPEPSIAKNKYCLPHFLFVARILFFKLLFITIITVICIHTVSGFSIAVTKLKPNQVSVNPGDEVFIKFNVNDLEFSSYDNYLEYSTTLIDPKWLNGCMLDCDKNDPGYIWDETRLHIERPFGFKGIDNLRNGVSGKIPSSSSLSDSILVKIQKRGPGIPVSSTNAAILKYSDVFSTSTTIPTPMTPTPMTPTLIKSQTSSPTKVTPSGLEIDKNTTSWIFGILIAAILFGIIEYVRSKKSGIKKK